VLSPCQGVAAPPSTSRPHPLRVCAPARQTSLLNLLSQADPDRIKVSLGKGWNRLSLKVTNLAAGWEAWVRVVAPDGGKLGGLSTEAE